MHQLAQLLKLPTITSQPTIEFRGPLPTLSDNPNKVRFESLGDIINLALKYLFPIAGLILFLYLIFAGFQLLTSAGDSKKIESAKGRITSTLIGFILLVASYWIVKIVEIIISPQQPFF